MKASYLLLALLIATPGICTGCYQRIERQVNDEGGVYQSVTIADQPVLCIVGRDEQWEKRTIPVSDINEAQVRSRKYDVVGTVALAVTIVGSAIGLFFAALRVGSWH